MFEQGSGVGLAVRWPVEIEGQWNSLAATAASLASETRAAAADLESAQSAWGGLMSSYRETETQEVVYSALDESPRVVREWSDVAEAAAEVLQSFATEANGLQQRSVELNAQAARLQSRLMVSDLITGGGGDSGGEDSAEDDALRREIEVHNTDVMALDSRWQQVESETAADLDSIASGGGLQEEIPVTGHAGGGMFAGLGGTLMPAAGLGLAGGPHRGDTGGGADGATLLAAVTHMLRQGAHADQEDPVQTAQDLYERASGGDATGQDIQDFRDHLASMDESEIQEFSESTDEIHENSLPGPRSEEDYADWPSGEDGHEWWESLENAGTQEAMREHLPLLVGNVQGVPYSQRNTANRDALDRLKQNPEYDAWDKNLTEIENSLTRTPNSPPRMLLSLDVGQQGDDGWDRQPLASVSVGDPDTADTTTFGAAGMGSGTDDMHDEVNATEDLQQDLEEAGGGSHAAVSWIGYDPPPEMWESDWGSVLGDERASAGGWDFAYALDGFHETRSEGEDGGGDFTVNVHAHSYGTNMSAHALTRTTYEVDSFAMYGSSGIPSAVADQASDFTVAKDSEGEPMVFASESWKDTTAGMGRVGSWGSRIDPTTLGFGAQEHYSGTLYGREDSDLDDVTDHGRLLNDDDPDEYGYLDPTTTHYRNLTYILSGRHDDMYSAEDHLEDWGGRFGEGRFL